MTTKTLTIHKTIDDFKKMVADEKRRDLGLKTLEKLLLELSVRVNNDHVGTGMGGNPSEWWFLINNVLVIRSSSSGEVEWSTTKKGEIAIHIDQKPNMRQVRESLTAFYSNHPQKLSVTDEQLVNPSFLRDQQIRTTNAKIYLRAVETGLELVKWLDIKIELDGEISKVFSKEKNVFRAAFLKEMDFPSTHFDDVEEEPDPLENMYRKHPTWGVKDAAASKRYQTMFDNLLSQEDLDKMIFIGSCPTYITMPAFRRTVQIERMVRLNLDEKAECDFLTRINSLLNDDDLDEEIPTDEDE